MAEGRIWSKRQEEAITESGKNLLVAAAAGSGKTSVLVERIIRRILSDKADVDKLLVVTFTNAAAAEMRERIGAALEEKIKDGVDIGHLERQMALLSNASISTLHSFCQTIIRRNFAAIDLDPKFRLANEQEMKILQRETLETLFEEKYEAQQKDFLSLVETYGSERGDEAAYHMVLSLYTFSCSQPFPELWLDGVAARFDLPEGTRLLDTPWGEAALEDCRLTFLSCLDAIKPLVGEASSLGWESCVPTLEADEEMLQNALDCLARKDWEGMRQLLPPQTKFKMLRFPRGLDDSEKDAIKKTREAVKNKINQMTAMYFHSSEAVLLEDLRALSPVASALVALVREFSAAFQAEKKEKRLVDFNDLEHFALAVLCREDAPKGELRPSAAALALQEKYEEVMVDEYQDTNGVQEAILSLIRREDNFFVVGDVKQSIYRFRMTDPTLFLKKYTEYPTLGEKYHRVVLAENYRSRAGILAAVNWIFSQVMVPESMELAYDKNAALYPAAKFPETKGENLSGATELYLIERDSEDENREEAQETKETKESADAARDGEEEGEEAEELEGFALEAAFIAQYVRSLVESGKLVADKEGYRPLRWRDIVILLRAVSGKADVLMEKLRDADVPAYAVLSEGYFEAMEVRVMLAALAVIDNERQDIPLAAVLHSPLVGLSASELAELRLIAPEEDLFGALLIANRAEVKLPEELRAKAAVFRHRLSEWRRLAWRVSVSELIWQIYRDTGYYDYVGGMNGGLLRQANLRMLCDRARDYEQTSFRGLFRFLRYIEELKKRETDLSTARTLGESEDVVRIMTIHKSKGLEFPVVIVADLGKGFNVKDAEGDLLMHRELGIGLYRVEKERSLRYSTLSHETVAACLRKESKAEELRVLYVAMTRAKEKLILVGSVKKLAARAEKWCAHTALAERQLPAYVPLEAKNLLDWVATAVARHADGAPIRELTEINGIEAVPLGEDDSHWDVRIVPASSIRKVQPAFEEDDEIFARLRTGAPLPASEEKEHVEKILSWRYAEWGVADVPAKLSVTELKRRFAAEEAAEDSYREPHGASRETETFAFKRPNFVQKKEKLSPSEYGTLMHTVLQHVDLAGDLSEKGIEAQLETMAQKEILLPEQIKSVDSRAIEDFFAQSLGAEMKKANRLWRELPFSRMVEARRFYPDAEPEARIFLQGIIDVLFERADGKLTLLDYKTDRNTRPDVVRKKYQQQIDLYAEAVAAIFGRAPEERYLYLLHNGAVVSL